MFSINKTPPEPLKRAKCQINIQSVTATICWLCIKTPTQRGNQSIPQRKVTQLNQRQLSLRVEQKLAKNRPSIQITTWILCQAISRRPRKRPPWLMNTFWRAPTPSWTVVSISLLTISTRATITPVQAMLTSSILMRTTCSISTRLNKRRARILLTGSIISTLQNMSTARWLTIHHRISLRRLRMLKAPLRSERSEQSSKY